MCIRDRLRRWHCVAFGRALDLQSTRSRAQLAADHCCAVTLCRLFSLCLYYTALWFDTRLRAVEPCGWKSNCIHARNKWQTSAGFMTIRYRLTAYRPGSAPSSVPNLRLWDCLYIYSRKKTWQKQLKLSLRKSSAAHVQRLFRCVLHHSCLTSDLYLCVLSLTMVGLS